MIADSLLKGSLLRLVAMPERLPFPESVRPVHVLSSHVPGPGVLLVADVVLERSGDDPQTCGQGAHGAWTPSSAMTVSASATTRSRVSGGRRSSRPCSAVAWLAQACSSPWCPKS